MGDIEEPIRKYIMKESLFDKPEVVLENDMPIIEKGIVDSLGVFSLISFIEKPSQVKIQPEDVVMENFGTINAIKGLVTAKMAAGDSK